VPLAIALELAGQVAEALEAAHQHGIIHRDLKPANVKITPKNRVKVLDFGLAKAIWSAERAEPAQPSPAASEETMAGQIVGTPAYMSPEQARGGEVDQRTDVWAFGCLLFELLAGRRPFEGTSVSEMHAAVLEREPDWSALPPKIPTRLRALLRQCLQKERNCRPDDLAVIRGTLQQVQHARQRRRTVRIRAVAVLPLANLSQDPEQDYFADGMTETLIAELAEVSALRVISRTSAMHYKGTTKTIPQIARELRVDGIVEGSVMQAGDRVRITTQLIHAATDRHLWAHSYEGVRRDVLRLQGDVARANAAMRVGTFPAPMKAQYALKGLCERYAAAPIPPLTDAEMDQLRAQLTEAGVLKSLAVAGD
jgi:TolB-like protein